MKKAVCVICMAALLCAALCGCGSFRLISIPVRGSSGAAMAYSSGNAEITDRITDVEVEWAAGSVDIIYAGDKIVLEESASRELNDENRMAWSVDGTRLVIKFTKDNVFGSINFAKALTLTLPEEFRAQSISVSCASAAMKAEYLSAKRLELSSASGRITVGSCEADEIEISTASGDVDVAQSGKCGELEIDSASGKVSARLDRVDELSIDTASGSVEVSADTIGEAGIETSSGGARLTVYSAFDELEIDSASGRVSLLLPEAQGFTALVDTASGRLESDLALAFKGGRYVYGSGSARLEIDTSSGDITIGCAK